MEIYLDNAATTRHKPPQVIEAVVAAMRSLGNPGRGAHGDALQAARVVYDARCKLAKFFGCPRPDHVVFTANATDALNIAIQGTLQPGDHVITTDLEHNSVLRPLYRLEAAGQISLDFVPADTFGCVKLNGFAAMIRPETRAIVCTHASNLTGQTVDIAAVGKLAKQHGLLLIVDASQTAGVLPIDMQAMGIDILCFTGHKGLMGPQGTGGLCIRPGVEVQPLRVGGSGVQSYSKTQPDAYPTRLEAGTLNSHGIAGLSAALDFLQAIGLDAVYAHEQALLRRFYNGVANVAGVTVCGDFAASAPRCGILSLNIRDYDSAEVSDWLASDYGIATRPGAHCAPRMHMALGTQTQGAVRFSFSWFNTEEEVDAAIRAVQEIAAQ